jgi:hypothetical protein
MPRHWPGRRGKKNANQDHLIIIKLFELVCELFIYWAWIIVVKLFIILIMQVSIYVENYVEKI